MVPATTPAPMSEAASRQAAIERARADSMRLPYTAADIHFMSAMIHHHAQAIEMSRLAPTRASNNGVKLLASRIINSQRDEIGIMQRWLEDRNQPVPEAKGGPMKMMMNGVEHEMLMDGMLTPEQMQELGAATGNRFDELFLRYMIQHHRGAVTMVKELFATPGAGQDEMTFRLATDVNVDQITEINRMERLLFDVVVERPTPE
jgi:uncharacterized protein (DUF305 family)